MNLKNKVRRWHSDLTIRNGVLLYILHVVFTTIYKLPYWYGGMRIMWWILVHTPADENETK